ncbi:hypothetical protein RN001_002377 [Aquatica leii]|uniref:YqaJ viral recombinase domain-containing protein n=1 Tax=Aquatica leii TaxID=1421715 RepID=A0AAN7PMB1_9COLE|nr:hypothetical protein RN001_002377 [Aquatica leii]
MELDGRRIVDFQYFFTSMKTVADHGARFGCSMNNLNIVGERRIGLNSIIRLFCNMCNTKFNLNTFKESEKTEMDLNEAAVSGSHSIGIGFSNLEELLSTMDIPCMSYKKIKTTEDVINDGWEKAANIKMKEAAIKEAECARSIGRIDNDGVPLLEVVADGCWSKRSYRSNYSALSGAAAIVGHQFGEVIYLGVKNKYCSQCQISTTTGINKPHKCYKNFEGSSTSMESTILAEGFKMSEKLFGVRYSTLIADGDSSTYKKILETRPYKNRTVEKIECINHLLRNFCNKLKALTIDTRFPVLLRKQLGKNILRFRSAVVGAIKYRKENNNNSNSVTLLKTDIDNSYYHIFGNHRNCLTYYCNRTNEEDWTTKFQECSQFHIRIVSALTALSNHSRSLLQNKNSNIVEQFHSIVAKFIGGKRINFTNRRSYQSRCYASVVSHNTKKTHYFLHKSMYGSSPGKIIKAMEIRRKLKSENLKKRRLFQTKKKRFSKRENKSQQDVDYGEFCEKPDMDPEIYKIKERKFLDSLKLSPEERNKIEKDTIHQADSALWLELRRKLITASHFHSICNRRDTTSCKAIVCKLLYDKSDLSNVASLKHGRQYESIAKKSLEAQENVVITDNGLFIDEEFNFIGATPDGLIGENLTVEIKCPYSAFNQPVEEGIANKKIKFWTYDKKTGYKINKKHPWYYQIQGQLRVTNRRCCLLAVWTGPSFPLKVEYVLKRNDFWKNHIESKLIQFYMNCVLPEIVDPRHARNMPIRDPQYITEAQQRHKEKKAQKTKPKK